MKRVVVRAFIIAAFALVVIEAVLFSIVMVLGSQGVNIYSTTIQPLESNPIWYSIIVGAVLALYVSPLVKLIGGILTLLQESRFRLLGVIPLVTLLGTPYLMLGIGCGFFGCR